VVKIHILGIKIPVFIGPNLLQTGWYGGQWVKFVGRQIVEKAGPIEAVGFLLYGYKLSDMDGKPYSYIDMDGGSIFVPYKHENDPVKAMKKVVMVSDVGYYDFNKNSYDTTQNYSYNEHLFANNDGILTNQKLGGPDTVIVGVVGCVPQDNNGWLGVLQK